MCDVEKLRKEIMEDGVVTKEKVESLWEIKDAQDDNTSSEFDLFFAEVVMSWLLVDNKIDKEKAQYLIDKISEDIDDAEIELLLTIQDYYEEGAFVPGCLIDEFPEYFISIEE